MYLALFTAAAVAVTSFFHGAWGERKGFLYDLQKPDKQITLPAVLHEISGITEVDSVSFACVQDENGFLFFYDLVQNRITRELPFAYNGDYEGVARVGVSIYVLRSDGSIYEIPDYRKESASPVYYTSTIPADNNEGLCYDLSGNRLLIGSKGKVEDESRLVRTIFAFDLETKKMLPDPVYKFDVAAVTKFAVERKLTEAYKVTGKGKVVPRYLKFQTSEIAIHPLSGDLYLLSASDRMLFVFDKKGAVVHIEPLDQNLFNKPEGITFLKNGDMVVTNEGGDNYPTLLRFNMKRP